VFGSLARHVKWFTDPSRHPTDYSLLLTLPVIVAFALAGIAIAAAAWVQRNVPEPRIFRALERFAWLGPLALGLHVGIALIWAAALGVLFVPSLRVERDELGLLLLAVEAVCGVLLLVGFGTRVAAVALALLGVVAMMPFSFESILEQVHILGIAIFLFVTGRGALSIDRVFRQQRALKVPEAPAVALTLLRVCMGAGIAFGYATCGEVGFEGRSDYAAIGAVTNLASRLADEATAGQFLISQRLYAEVEDDVEVEPVGEFMLKGFQRPIAAFNVIAICEPAKKVPATL